MRDCQVVSDLSYCFVPSLDVIMISMIGCNERGSHITSDEMNRY